MTLLRSKPLESTEDRTIGSRNVAVPGRSARRFVCRSPRPRPWDETLNRWLIDTQEQHPALSALAFVLVFLCLVYVQVRYICPTKPPHGAPFPEW